MIIARRDKPVRVTFYNQLPAGAPGKSFGGSMKFSGPAWAGVDVIAKAIVTHAATARRLTVRRLRLARSSEPDA